MVSVKGSVKRIVTYPAYVMRKRLHSDERRIAIPPWEKMHANRKFCDISYWHSIVYIKELTKRVMPSENSTRMSRYLKNLSASLANPTTGHQLIQERTGSAHTEVDDNAALSADT